MKLKPLLSLPVLATLAVLGVLLALDLAALAATRRFDDAVSRFAGEARLQSMLAALPAIVLDMESGVRGYVLTGERAELARYRAASTRFSAALATAAERAGDNDPLAGRLVEVQALGTRWIEARLSPMVVKRDAGAGSTESMREIVQSLRVTHGDPLATRIRESLAGVQQFQEERVGQARLRIEAESDKVAGWMQARALALLLLVAGLALVLGRTLARLTGQTSSRETAERIARESGAALQGMNDASALGTFVTDADGALRRANAAFERMTGLPGAALAASGWPSALHPDDRERVTAAWTAATSAAAPFASEHRFLHRNGNVVWARMQGAGIEDDGKPIGYVVTAEDVTERRAAEDALRRSEERLQLALENAEFALFDWHLPSGEIVLSRQWRSLVGAENSEVGAEISEDGSTTARRFSEWLHRDDRESLREALIAAFKGGTRGFQAQFRVRTASGQWKRLRAQGRVTERDALGRAVQFTGTLAAMS